MTASAPQEVRASEVRWLALQSALAAVAAAALLCGLNLVLAALLGLCTAATTCLGAQTPRQSSPVARYVWVWVHAQPPRSCRLPNRCVSPRLAAVAPNGCLNDAPCPPFTSHGASIRQPCGDSAGGGTDIGRLVPRAHGRALAPPGVCGHQRGALRPARARLLAGVAIRAPGASQYFVARIGVA
jgi:hypothetical protein